jgi:probable rRNA maturation factor
LALQLTIFAAAARQCVPALRRGLTGAHRILRSPLNELSLAIVSGPQMALLHGKFLGRTGPTDVLTFELDHDARGRVLCGEIVVCSTLAKARARQLGHPLCHELLLYAIHGLLHLCAFDDRIDSAFAAMHAKEDEILTRLGIGPVFAPRNGRLRLHAGRLRLHAGRLRLRNGVRKCRST